jgi:hypothetical protein
VAAAQIVVLLPAGVGLLDGCGGLVELGDVGDGEFLPQGEVVAQQTEVGDFELTIVHYFLGPAENEVAGQILLQNAVEQLVLAVGLRRKQSVQEFEAFDEDDFVGVGEDERQQSLVLLEPHQQLLRDVIAHPPLPLRQRDLHLLEYLENVAGVLVDFDQRKQQKIVSSRNLLQILLDEQSLLLVLL